MKKIFIALALTLSAGVVVADCVTNTIINKDGSVKICTTCCEAGSCVTTCF